MVILRGVAYVCLSQRSSWNRRSRSSRRKADFSLTSARRPGLLTHSPSSRLPLPPARLVWFCSTRHSVYGSHVLRSYNLLPYATKVHNRKIILIDVRLNDLICIQSYDSILETSIIDQNGFRLEAAFVISVLGFSVPVSP